MVLPSIGLGSDRSFSMKVEKLWHQGSSGIQEVNNISSSRLSKNPNDLIGLTLALEYTVLYSRFDEVRTLRKRIVVIGKETTSKEIQGQINLLNLQVNDYFDSVKLFPSEVLNDAKNNLIKKGGGAGLPMLFIGVVKACEDEGMVEGQFVWCNWIWLISVLLVIVLYRVIKQHKCSTLRVGNTH